MRKHRILSLVFSLVLVWTIVLPTNVFASEIELPEIIEETVTDFEAETEDSIPAETDAGEALYTESPDESFLTDEAAGDEAFEEEAYEEVYEEFEAEEELPAYYQFSVGNAEVSVSAEPGVLPETAGFSVASSGSAEVQQAAENILNVHSGEWTVIRHQIFYFSGNEINGSARVTITNLGFRDLRNQYSDASLNIYLVHSDEAAAVYADVDEGHNSLSFNLNSFGFYDVVSVISIPEPVVENVEEESAPVEVAEEEPAPVEETEEEPAPVEATEEEPAPVEVTEEEPAPVEVTEEEPAPVEATEEEPAPVEVTEEEPAPVEETEEEPAPVEETEEEPAPVEETEEEPAPVEVTEEEPAPVEVTEEEPAPIEETEEEPAPVEVTEEEPAPVEETEEKPAPVEETEEEPAPVEETEKEPAPVEVTEEEPVPVEETEEEPAPVEVTEEEPAPVEETEEELAPVEETEEEPAPVEETEEEPAPVEVTEEEPAPVEETEEESAPVEVTEEEPAPVEETEEEPAPVEEAKEEQRADQGVIIVSQPQDVYAAEEEEASFTVQVNADGVEYQWQRCKDDENWQDINENSQIFTGSRTAILSFTVSSNTSSRQYRCVISSGDTVLAISDTVQVAIAPAAEEKETSQPATVQTAKDNTETEEEAIEIPSTDADLSAESYVDLSEENLESAQKDALSIVSMPQSVYAEEGDEVSFTVLANQDDAAYQWQRCKDGESWQDIKANSKTYQGSQSAALSFTATSGSIAQLYRCVVTFEDETVETAAVQVLSENTLEETPTEAEILDEPIAEELAEEDESAAVIDSSDELPENKEADQEITIASAPEDLYDVTKAPLMNSSAALPFVSGAYYWDGAIEKESSNIYIVTSPDTQYIKMYGSGQSAVWTIDDMVSVDSNDYNKTVIVPYYFEEYGVYNLKYAASVDGENWGNEFASETLSVERPPVIDWFYGPSIENTVVEIGVNTNVDMTTLQICIGEGPIAVWTEGQEGIEVVNGGTYKYWHGFITPSDFAEGEYPFKESGTYYIWYKATDENNTPYHAYSTDNRPSMTNLIVNRPDVIDVEYYERIFENEPAHIYVTTNLEMEYVHMHIPHYPEEIEVVFSADNCEGIENYLTCKTWDIRYTFEEPGDYYAWYNASKDGSNTGRAFSGIVASVERHDIIYVEQPETGMINEPVNILVTTNLAANYLYIMEGEEQVGMWEFNAENENMDLWTSCKDWRVEVTFDQLGTHSLWYRVSSDGETIRNAYPDTPTVISEPEQPEETFELDDVLYATISETTLRVVKYNGSSSSVVIPETVNGKTVTEIGESAFEGNTDVTSIDLPDTIEVIRTKAFKNCVNLANIY